MKKTLNSFSEDELYHFPATPGLDPTFPSLSQHSPQLHHKKFTPPSTTPIHSTSSLPSHMIDSHNSVNFKSSSPKRQSSLDGTETGQKTLSHSHVSNGMRTDPQTTSESNTSSTIEPSSSASHSIPRTDSKTTNKTHRRMNSDLFMTPVSSPQPTPPPSPQPEQGAENISRIGDRVRHRINQQEMNTERKTETFFSKAPQKFEDLVLVDGERIPTAEFLDCCRAVVPFFGELECLLCEVCVCCPALYS